MYFFFNVDCLIHQLNAIKCIWKKKKGECVCICVLVGCKCECKCECKCVGAYVWVPKCELLYEHLFLLEFSVSVCMIMQKKRHLIKWPSFYWLYDITCNLLQKASMKYLPAMTCNSVKLRIILTWIVRDFDVIWK